MVRISRRNLLLASGAMLTAGVSGIAREMKEWAEVVKKANFKPLEIQ